MSCKICYQGTCRLIKCNKCSDDACIRCYKKTISISSDIDVLCIFCKNKFCLDFLIKEFGHAYIWGRNTGNYREHREKLLLEQQLIMLPETQILVEKDIKIEKCLSNLKEYDIQKNDLFIKSRNSRKEIIELNKSIEQSKFNFNNEDTLLLLKEKNEKKQQLDIIKMYYVDLCSKINNEEISLRKLFYQEIDKDTDNKFLTRGHCPNSKCNGFIMDKWTCGICSSKICHSCLELLNDKVHVCNPDLVKNIEEIRINTKPCPNCRVKVFKINGCQQMFCTNCKIFFDWSSLEIIKKTTFVHNPHYTEWISSLNNQVNDEFISSLQQGQECFNNGLTHQLINTLFIDKPRLKRYIVNLFQNLNHMADYNNLNRLELKLDLSLLELRKKYLKNIIDKKEFSRKIQINYKKFQKECELNDIKTSCYEFFINYLRIFIISYKEKKDEEVLKTFVTNIYNYHDYILESMRSSYKLYGSKAEISVNLDNSLN